MSRANDIMDELIELVEKPLGEVAEGKMTDKQISEHLQDMLRGSGLSYYVSYSEQDSDYNDVLTAFSVHVGDDYSKHFISNSNYEEKIKTIEEVAELVKSQNHLNKKEGGAAS